MLSLAMGHPHLPQRKVSGKDGVLRFDALFPYKGLQVDYVHVAGWINFESTSMRHKSVREVSSAKVDCCGLEDYDRASHLFNVSLVTRLLYSSSSSSFSFWPISKEIEIENPQKLILGTYKHFDLPVR